MRRSREPERHREPASSGDVADDEMRILRQGAILPLWDAPQPEPFKRDVVAREPCPDGSEYVKLSCGHTIARIIPSELPTMDCSECAREFVARRQELIEDLCRDRKAKP